MPDRARPWKHWFAAAADTAFAALIAVALLLQYIGRLRLEIGPVTVTSRSGARAFALAAAVALVRHVVVLRPSLVDRIAWTLPALRRLSIDGGRLAYYALARCSPLKVRRAKTSSLR